MEPDQAQELVRRGATLGPWLTRRGKLLTLTSGEARAAGLTAGTASTRKELLEVLGIKAVRTHDLKSHAEVAKALRKREEHLRKLDGKITAQLSRAQAMHPSNSAYQVYTEPHGRHGVGDFVDGGRAWRERTAACVRAYDLCLSLCREKLKLARKYPDFRTGERQIMEFMVKVKLERDRVAAAMNAQGLPGN